MNISPDNFKDIKNDVSFMKSNKLSINQSKMYFAGFSYSLILNKKVFPSNKDLEIFLDKVYVQNSNDKEPLKKYLFASRTLLGAKIGRLILTEFDYTKLLTANTDLLNFFNNILNEDEENNNLYSNKKKSSLDKETSSWINTIKGSGDTEK